MTLANEVEQAVEELHSRSDTDQLREVISSLFSDDNIKLKSVLNGEQVVANTLALAFAAEYGVDIIDKVALFFMQLKVSDKARGRGDMRAVLMSLLKSEKDDDTKEYDRLINR